MPAVGIQIIDEDGNAQLLSKAILEEILSKATEFSVATGDATDGSTTTLEDTDAVWEVNKWVDAIVEITDVSTDKHYFVTIISNTADTLTFGAIAATVVAGDHYEIRMPLRLADIDKWGGTSLTGRDVSLDLKALTDPAITGILKSIGDIAALENLITRIGQTSDAVVDAGATGSLSAKLIRLTTDLNALNTLIGATDAALVDAGAVGAVSSKLRRLTTDIDALLTSLGATDDAIVAAGAVGSVSAKLRRVTQGLEDLKTLIVLAAGSAIIGKVGIDQTTDGTTNKVYADIAKVLGTALSATNPVIVRLTDGTAVITSPIKTQLPAALSAGSNLKISHEEAAIAVPADLQAHYYVKSIRDIAPGAVGTFWLPETGNIDLSNYIHSSWYIYAPTTGTMVIDCYLNISHDGGTTWRRAKGYEILDATFVSDVWNSIDVPLMLCEAKLEVVIGTAFPATLDLMCIRKA